MFAGAKYSAADDRQERMAVGGQGNCIWMVRGLELGSVGVKVGLWSGWEEERSKRKSFVSEGGSLTFQK
jgi:hypothetical protein